MISWRRRRQGDAPTPDIRIEDRRTSSARPPARASAKLVVDYAGDPNHCQDVLVSLMEEYEQYVESEHAICPGCPAVRSGPMIVYSMLE